VATLEAARALARLGWPVLPVTPGGKEPLSRNGVNDATTDAARIAQWWGKWPDANVGVATGAPGPTVLDIDNPKAAADVLPKLLELDAPQAATVRGRHLYFRGNESGTIKLGYGELRGRGSYVVAPPSIHPSGKEYVWLVEPNGPLQRVPEWIAGDHRSKGAGVRVPRERVAHGERHDYLTDHAVRLVRSGVTEPEAIERALVAEYDAVCDKKPAALPHYFTKIAKWAASSDIATRERERAKKPAKRSRSASRTLPLAPARDAALGELRAFVATAGGVPDVLRIDEVVRFGVDPGDALHVKLSNGMRVKFERQEDVMTPKAWQGAWIGGTSGVCRPPSLKIAELADVYWACCVIATSTAEERFEVDLQELVDELVDMAERVAGTLTEVEPRYLLLGALRDRPRYDAADRGAAKPPALVVDMRNGRRYLRASELQSLADYRKLGISKAQFAGRMRMIRLERRLVQGDGDSGHRKQVLYELPPDEATE